MHRDFQFIHPREEGKKINIKARYNYALLFLIYSPSFCGDGLKKYILRLAIIMHCYFGFIYPPPAGRRVNKSKIIGI